MNKMNENYCPQCRNHCPSDRLRCERGFRYFEENETGYSRNDREDGPRMRRHMETGRPDFPFEEHGFQRHHEENSFMGCRMDRPFPSGDDMDHFHEEGRHCRPHRRREMMLHDPEDLEGMFAACAREMRRGRRRRFGSTQDRIIRILDENGGTMGQKALQQLLDIQPGSISEILAKMEDKGLIVRSRDSDDRRAALITLQTKESAGEEKNDFFSILNDEEKETLKNLLQKILNSRKPEQQ